MASGFDRMWRGGVIWQSELGQRESGFATLIIHVCALVPSQVSQRGVNQRDVNYYDGDSKCNKVAMGQSLGHLVQERHGDGANFCVFEKGGEGE